MAERAGFTSAGLFIVPFALFMFFAVIAANGGPVVPGSSQADIEFAAENLTATNFTSPSLSNPTGGLFDFLGNAFTFVSTFVGEGGLAIQALFATMVMGMAYAAVDAFL